MRQKGRMLLLVLGLGACTEPTANLGLFESASVRFSLASRGADSLSLSGRTVLLPTRAGGFAQTWATGRYSADLVPILLADEANAGYQLSIGLLGELRPGTYRVRRAAANPNGVLEFVATLIVPAADGSGRHYEIDAGVLTVHRVRPLFASLQGSASRVTTMPADLAPGLVVRSIPTALTVIAEIGR